MTIRRIPQNHRWTGPYLGSFYGALWKTFNIDLDRNEGKIGLSLPMDLVEDSSEMVGGSPVTAFLRTDADCEDRYWALSNNELLKTDSAAIPNPGTDWDADAIANTPTDILDFTVHGNDSRNDCGRNKLFVTRDSGDIAVLNDTGNNAWTASWWVTKHSQPKLDTNALLHPIEYFPLRKITLVGDGNLIHTISRPSDTQNDTVTYARLVLPNEFSIRHIFTTTARAWILCTSKTAKDGAIIEWDGFSQTYNQIHSSWGLNPLTGVNYGEVPIVINAQGVILEYTGGGFSPMERSGQPVAFPVLEEFGSGSLGGYNTNNRFFSDIGTRGMTVGEDGLIYILNAGSGSGFRQGSGIWCLNPKTGRFYNKHSLGFVGNSRFGQQNMPGGISAGGAVMWIPRSVLGQTLLVGGLIRTDASTNETGIFLLGNAGTTETRGYFVTQYVSADDIKELWDTVWIRFNRFDSASSRIVLKAIGTRHMTSDSGERVEGTITWTDDVTFTVTLQSGDDALAVGDEVEVVGGVNAGTLSHISTITGAHAALQTVTVDEAMPANETGTSIAYFDRWKKLKTITSTDIYEDSANIGIDSSFIQFKVELRGIPVKMEVSDLTVISKPSLTLQN